MRIYITASFQGDANDREVEELCAAVRRAGFEDYCFVRDESDFVDEYDMMKKAKEQIAKSDILLMEYDGPTHGRMIELGMAYDMGKKIVIIVKQGVTVKDTVIGVSDRIIQYEELEDIVEPMQLLYKERNTK